MVVVPLLWPSRMTSHCSLQNNNAHLSLLDPLLAGQHNTHEPMASPQQAALCGLLCRCTPCAPAWIEGEWKCTCLGGVDVSLLNITDCTGPRSLVLWMAIHENVARDVADGLAPCYDIQQRRLASACKPGEFVHRWLKAWWWWSATVV